MMRRALLEVVQASVHVVVAIPDSVGSDWMTLSPV